MLVSFVPVSFVPVLLSAVCVGSTVGGSAICRNIHVVTVHLSFASLWRVRQLEKPLPPVGSPCNRAWSPGGSWSAYRAWAAGWGLGGQAARAACPDRRVRCRNDRCAFARLAWSLRFRSRRRRQIATGRVSRAQRRTRCFLQPRIARTRGCRGCPADRKGVARIARQRGVCGTAVWTADLPAGERRMALTPVPVFGQRLQVSYVRPGFVSLGDPAAERIRVDFP